jgi:hypothetical protein
MSGRFLFICSCLYILFNVFCFFRFLFLFVAFASRCWTGSIITATCASPLKCSVFPFSISWSVFFVFNFFRFQIIRMIFKWNSFHFDQWTTEGQQLPAVLVGPSQTHWLSIVVRRAIPSRQQVDPHGLETRKHSLCRFWLWHLLQPEKGEFESFLSFLWKLKRLTTVWRVSWIERRWNLLLGVKTSWRGRPWFLIFFLAPVPATPFTFTFYFIWPFRCSDKLFYFIWLWLRFVQNLFLCLCFGCVLAVTLATTEKGLQTSEKDGRSADWFR